MKEYSFYQFIKTRMNENSPVGNFAEAVAKDSLFPKYSKDYNEISDYLEKYPYDGLPLEIFDDAFETYQNWLNY